MTDTDTDPTYWCNRFALDNPAPAVIVLIAGDGDYLRPACKLIQRGYAVHLFIPKRRVANSILDSRIKIWDWDACMNNEGLLQVTDARSSTYKAGTAAEDMKKTDKRKRAATDVDAPVKKKSKHGTCFNKNVPPCESLSMFRKALRLAFTRHPDGVSLTSAGNYKHFREALNLHVPQAFVRQNVSVTGRPTLRDLIKSLPKIALVHENLWRALPVKKKKKKKRADKTKCATTRVDAPVKKRSSGAAKRKAKRMRSHIIGLGMKLV